MKKFLRDILLYAIPIILLIVGYLSFFLVGYYSGEYVDIDNLIKKQREDSSIILGLGYNEQRAYYKMVNANYYNAEVIALGTSRAMQFKDVYFSKSFYNCGGAVSGNYDEYKNFLRNLNYTPSVILLDLDTWVFNDAWNINCKDYSSFIEISLIDRDKLIMTNSIIKDFLDGRWTFSELKTYPGNVGFNGRIKDEGFMCDGSYYYGLIYRYPEDAEDYNFLNTLSRIENGSQPFEYGNHIDEDTLEQLQSFLEYCYENNIYVIGYIAPFAPGIYQTMLNSGNYGYLKEITPACEKIFEHYGYALYDYGDGAVLGVNDEYFIDGFHGSEVVYGLMIQDIIGKNGRLEQCIDKNKLDFLLNSKYNNIVFENPDKREIQG